VGFAPEHDFGRELHSEHAIATGRLGLDKPYDEWSMEQGSRDMGGKKSTPVRYRNYPDIRVGYLPGSYIRNK
jgi:hypothetical protein